MAKRVLWASHGGKVVPQQLLRTGGLGRRTVIPLGSGEQQQARAQKFFDYTVECPSLSVRRRADWVPPDRCEYSEVRGHERQGTHVGPAGLGEHACHVRIGRVVRRSGFGVDDIQPNHGFAAPDADCGAITEIVSLTTLKGWQRGAEDRGAGVLKKYIKYCEPNGNPSERFPFMHGIVVEYARNFGVRNTSPERRGWQPSGALDWTWISRIAIRHADVPLLAPEGGGRRVPRVVNARAAP